MKFKQVLFLMLFPILLAACAEPYSRGAKREIRKDINCETAQEDIKILEKEKASAGKQLAAGVRSVLPVSAVVGILKGTWRDRTKVATGDYNKAIENKIKEIKWSCGLP